MDPKTVIQLYQDLLRKYPFSITGRPDPEKKLARFFSDVCQHPMIKERENIVFIYGLYAELEALHHDGLAVEKIVNWKTKPLKDVLLFNYEGEYPDLVLSFYLTLLSTLAGANDITAVNVIADNVRSDIDLRITATSFERPSIHFIERDDVLEFRTPCSIFKKELWDDKGHLKTATVRRILQSFLPPSGTIEQHLMATSNRKDPHLFKIDREKENIFFKRDATGAVTSSAVNEIFEQEQLDQTIDYYKDEFGRLSRRVLAGRLKSDLRIEDVSNLISIAIGGTFLAAYYDVNLDYVLSVCNVDRQTSNTLGGLAVGTKKKTPLTAGERALFSIISDHISANLAAQMAHQMFETQFWRGKANQILRRVAGDGTHFHTLLETVREGELPGQIAQQARETFNKENAVKVLSRKTASTITEYFSRLEQEDDEARQSFLKVKDVIYFEAPTLWEYLSKEKANLESIGVTVIMEPCKGTELCSRRLFADYRWLRDVLKIPLGNLTKERNKAFCAESFDDKANPVVKISVFFLDENNVRKYQFLPDEIGSIKSLNCVIEDNGIGCDVLHIPTRGGGYEELFREDYRNVLNAHGKITIESREKALDFFSPNKGFSSEFKDGTRVSFTLNLQVQ